MAKKPGLITGANAKIKIGDKTMAYATNVSYNVNIATIAIEVMSRPEVVDNVPIAYNVSGSFSIIRYASGGTTGQGDSSIVTDGKSNSPNNWTIENGALGTVGDQVDPKKMLKSASVDIEISLNNGTKIIKVTNCRIVARTSTIDKRSVFSESFSFMGELLSDDAITAAESDMGSDLS